MKWLAKILANRGWVLTDRLSFEDTVRADARGFIEGYPQFGRVAPFAVVNIYVEELGDEEEEDV